MITSIAITALGLMQLSQAAVIISVIRKTRADERNVWLARIG